MRVPDNHSHSLRPGAEIQRIVGVGFDGKEPFSVDLAADLGEVREQIFLFQRFDLAASGWRLPGAGDGREPNDASSRSRTVSGSSQRQVFVREPYHHRPFTYR